MSFSLLNVYVVYEHYSGMGLMYIKTVGSHSELKMFVRLLNNISKQIKKCIKAC